MFSKFRKIWMVLLFSSIAGMSAHGNNGTVERRDMGRFAVMVGSGFGNYQDIQLPDYIPETMRIDGKASVPKGDSQSHSGAPIFMRLSFFQERDELLRGAEFSILQIANMDMRLANANANAGYRRSSLISFAQQKLNEHWYGRLEGQLIRSFFSNISIGHVMDHLAAGGGFGLSLNEAQSLYVGGSFSFLSKLKFETGQKLYEFRQGQASMQLMEVKYNFRLDDSASIEIRGVSEQTDVYIKDQNEYRAFGFFVRDGVALDQIDYTMQTNSLTFGLQKAW